MQRNDERKVQQIDEFVNSCGRVCPREVVYQLQYIKKGPSVDGPLKILYSVVYFTFINCTTLRLVPWIISAK